MDEIIHEALSKGVEMHVAGEFELASKLYSSVMKLQPKHADANHNMGLLKVDTGQDLEALPYLQTALQADTSVAQFWLSYIKALIKLDKTAEATRILNLAKENGIENEELLELYQQLNETFSKTEIDRPATETETENSGQAEPNALNTLKLDQALWLAEQNVKQGSAEEAKCTYQDIPEKFSKNKKCKEAIKLLPVGAAPNSEGPPPERLKTLIELYNNGQYQTALTEIQCFMEEFPTSSMLYNIQGNFYAALKLFDLAICSFKTAIQINPDEASVHNNLGIAQNCKSNSSEAIKSFEKAIALNPNYADAFNGLGIAQKAKGNLDEAELSYKRAIEIDKNHALAYNNLGIIQQSQNKLHASLASFEKAIKIRPDYTEALNNLGAALQKKVNWMRQ